MDNSSTPRGRSYTPDTAKSIVSTEPFPPSIDQPLEPVYVPRKPSKTFDEMFPNKAKYMSKLTISDFVTLPPSEANPKTFWKEPLQRAQFLEPEPEYERPFCERIGEKEIEERRERLEESYWTYDHLLSSGRGNAERKQKLGEMGKVERRMEELVREHERIMGSVRQVESGKRRPWSWKKNDDTKMMRLTDGEMMRIGGKVYEEREDREGLKRSHEKSEDRERLEGGVWRRMTLRLSMGGSKLRKRMFH
ncbi:uncharacterized protein PAC_06678 [Phialocephala subalpina]|uniref:Uncharacterized protein n=1 Tax=Phialocephala subalpina TaxID=576137 RepID=A0A1L7WVJ3_9HELO|nr:uncharacterized protein PAC_06678 [Phialocephala subalpina]